MLLKLIKTRGMMSGSHCEVWEINHLSGNRHLADAFVLNDHLPLELIYRLTVTGRGICIQGRHCGWQWDGGPSDDGLEELTEYLRTIQATHEEIYIEVCTPNPILPGYPYIDYNPDDYPIVLMDT